jgi:hypothetical protein
MFEMRKNQFYYDDWKDKKWTKAITMSKKNPQMQMIFQ